MSRKPLYVALFCALFLSCVLTAATETFSRAHAYNRPHPEWLHMLVQLPTLPGAFFAMIMYGMCNTQTPRGWTVAILVNALFYAIPFVAVATAYRAHQRQKLQSQAEVLSSK